MADNTESNNETAIPRWQPLEAIERRVLGVLIEKAKTTPENYPLSLNSIRTACNQKSNRSPLMQLEEDQVEESLEKLRKIGAVSQIQGGARVDKYRHLAYEWLGVEKVELAVMAELLLRGTQTVGELRGRAARMEPIKDLGELQPTLESLRAKGMIVFLTPPGRGSVVTHALYLDREMDKVRREAGGEPASASGETPAQATWGRTSASPQMPAPQEIARERASAHTPARPQTIESPTKSAVSSIASSSDISALAEELRLLQQEFAEVKREFLAARAEFENAAEVLRRQLEDLNRQLGN